MSSLSSPTSHKDAIGYYWNVQAIGPNNLPGWQAGYNLLSQYMLQPPAPTLISPDSGAEFEEDQDVTLLWETAMAHGGDFVVNVWEDEDSCDGSPDKSWVVDRNASHGQFSLGLTNLHKSWHSWRVRPFIYNWPNSDPCQKPKWSACRKFKVKPEPPPPTIPPPDPIHQKLCGDTGSSMLYAFSVVPDATGYDIRIRDVNTNTIHVEVSVSAADAHYGDVPDHAGDWNVVWDNNPVHGHEYEWQFRSVGVGNAKSAPSYGTFLYFTQSCAGLPVLDIE